MAVSGSSAVWDKPAQPAFKAVSKRANTMTLPMELCCLNLEAICMQSSCNILRTRKPWLSVTMLDPDRTAATASPI